ncbi:MAG TPA: TIGR01777 family oxidoreductase, partial [Bacteroidia bacterium]|nr:TIGR01777 family oxidoreductase [Bacteroidia bacterium]
MKIVLAGGTGFLGKALQQFYCDQTTEIIVLSRSVNTFAQRKPSCDVVRHAYWPNKLNGDRSWMQELEGADFVINLAGKNVNCRYTDANKKEILESRVDATNAIAEAIRQCTTPPKLWINLSSATVYRHAEDRPQNEFTGEIGDGFSEDVVRAWEKAFAQDAGDIRKVTMRLGIVLGNGEGVIPRLKNLVRFGLGGKHGSGRQMVNWIHVDVFLAIVEWFRSNPEAKGAYNIVSPNPVTNAGMMRTMRKTMGMPFGLPAPEWMLAIGAWLIGTETELLLKSR